MCRTIDEDDFGNHVDMLREADEMEEQNRHSRPFDESAGTVITVIEP